MKNEDQQQLFMKARFLQEHSKEIEQSIEFINNQVTELQNLSETLSALDESKNNNFLAYFGKGIYANAEMKDKDLFVEVGSGVVVKKSPVKTKEVIVEQIAKFNDMKNHFLSQLEGINEELQNLMLSQQKG